MSVFHEILNIHAKPGLKIVRRTHVDIVDWIE